MLRHPCNVKFDTLKLKFCTSAYAILSVCYFLCILNGFHVSPRLSFPDYLKGDTHLAWMVAAPARDVISMRATIRRDLE